MSGWTEEILAEVAEIGAGNSAPQDKRLFDDGTYPFIRMSDVGKVRFGSISTATDFLNEEGIQGLRLVPIGTILVPKSGASTFLNHRVALAVDAYVSSHLATVRPRPEVCDGRFLLYYLSTVRAQDLIQDHSYPSLTISAIGAISVPLPPLVEQKRIAAALDDAFASLDRARANAEANLADADTVFECALLAAFDELLTHASMSTLADMSTDFSRGKSKHRPRNDPKLYGGAYPFIQTGDVRRAEGAIREYSQTYNDIGMAQSKLWPVGTVCITIAANIAETGVLEIEACFPDSVIGMVPDPARATPYYVEYMLRYFSKELKLKGKGSAQDNINLATFEDSMFPFPSLAEQEAIVAKLDELSKSVSELRSRYSRQIEEIDELRQSLLQAAFSGQLS